jgi:acetyltransferase-like isoleucine patch superfamily enzyme
MVNLKYLFAKGLKKFLNPPAILNTEIDKTARAASGGHIVNSCVGRFSYIGNYSEVINTEIGAFTSIADYCSIGGANHPMNWVSTSPVFHSGKNIMNFNFSVHEFHTTKSTKIGNDVWLGKGVFIKSGIRIGDGAIIGMGSVVTKDVEPYSIVAGNPAKLIRKRFDENTILALGELKWWNWDERKIRNSAKKFNDIGIFIEEQIR